MRRNSPPTAWLEAVAAATRGIRQGGPERRREPQEVKYGHAGHGGDQNPCAIADIKRDECVGRRMDMRLIAVDDL